MKGDSSVSPSIITSRRSAQFEFGHYVIIWARTFTFSLLVHGGGVGQPAVNYVHNNALVLRVFIGV